MDLSRACKKESVRAARGPATGHRTGLSRAGLQGAVAARDPARLVYATHPLPVTPNKKLRRKKILTSLALLEEVFVRIPFSRTGNQGAKGNGFCATPSSCNGNPLPGVIKEPEGTAGKALLHKTAPASQPRNNDGAGRPSIRPGLTTR